MITLYGFGRVFRPVIGETRDLRAQWTLEECGLPYRVKGIDHTGGEHKGEAYSKISPFNLLPAIEDGGVTVAESGAILVYLAEKSGKLIPQDMQGRMQVIQWCFAALSTVERPLMEIQLIDKFGYDGDARRAKLVEEARRWLDGIERQLEGRDWIASSEFSIADILLVTVLREIRRTDLLTNYPRLQAYYTRALERPAWQRTLAAYAKRLGVTVAELD